MTIKEDIATKELELADLNAKINVLRQSAIRKAEQIATLKKQLVEPTVSDHAMLRYIERVCWVDVESMKGQILTELP